MAIKRRDFQKLSSTVQEFLLKLPDEETSARLRDNLLHSLHFLQLYYRVLQNRDKNSSNENGTNLQWTIDHSLSPLTPFREAPDKFEWEWVNVESQRVRASFPKLPADNPKTLPPIINAIKDGDLDEVRNLIGSDPSLVNATDVFARDCCTYAVQFDRLDILELLIEKGANVNQVASDASTCLHRAAYKGHADTVELLLKNKAHINAQDCFNRSPLHWAIINPDTDCLKVLLKYDCNILIRDKDGLSPSMWACYLDHLDHFKLLHKLDPTSARVNLTNYDHMETDNDGRTWLHWSVRKNEPLKCLNFLLNEKTFLVRDKEGKTSLHVAAELGAIQACKSIIENLGSSVVNERDNKKQTPLHLATLYGQARAIKMLIDYGADPFIKDVTGASSIDYVTKRNLFFCNSIIEICLRNQERRQRKGAGSTNSLASTSSDPTNLTPAPPSIPKNPAYSRSFQYNTILSKEPNHSRHFHSGRPPRPINTTSFSNSVDNNSSLNASAEMAKTAPASLNNILGADELNDYGSQSANNLLMTRQPSPPPPRPGGILRGGWNSTDRVMSGSLRLSRASTRTSLASDDLDKYLNGTIVNSHSHNNIETAANGKTGENTKPIPTQPRVSSSSNSATNLHNSRPYETTTVSAASYELATPSGSSQAPPPIKPRKSSSLANLANPNLDSSLSSKYNQSIENLNYIISSSSTSQAPGLSLQNGPSNAKIICNHHHHHQSNNKSHPMHQNQVDVEDLSGDEEVSLTSMKGEGFASDLSDNEERARLNANRAYNYNQQQQVTHRTKTNKKSAAPADLASKRPQTPLDLRQDPTKRQPTAGQQQQQQPYTRFNEWDPYKGNADRQKSPQKSKGSANPSSQTNNFAYTFLGQDASPRQTSGRTGNNSAGTLSAGNSMIETTSATNLDLMVSGQRVGPPSNNTPRTDDVPSGKQQQPAQSQSQRPFTRRLKPLDNAPPTGEINLNSSGENQFLRQKTSKLTIATDRKKLEPLKGGGMTNNSTSQVDSITGDDHSNNSQTNTIHNTNFNNNINNDEEPSISENTFSNSDKQLFKMPKNKKVFSNVLKYT